jgi:hypothetical protein
MLRNILRVYRNATESELRAGHEWYSLAHEKAHALAGQYSITLPQAVGVIAALSPSNPWPRNVKDAEAVLRAVQTQQDEYRVTAYGPNKRKAERIARGEDPLVVLGGPKVRSFYDNILNPAESEAVTVDGHAYSVWAGARHTLGRLGTVPEITPRRYEAIAADYRRAADKLKVRPHELQATTWIAWRNKFLPPRFLTA